MKLTEQEQDLINDFKYYYEQFGKETLFREFDEKVLNLKNPRISAYFALIGSPNKDKHGDIVLESKDIEAIYALSKISSKHLEYLLDSHDVHNLDAIKLLFKEAILKYGKEGRYTLEVSEIGKKISRHAKSISESKDIDLLMEFLKWYSENIKIEKTYRYNRYNSWTEQVGRDILKHSNKYINNISKTISETKNPKIIYEALSLIKTIKGNIAYRERDTVYTTKLAEALAKTKDPEYNYKVISRYCLSDELFTMHENAIIESKNPEYNYYLAKGFGRSDKEKTAKVVLKSNSAKYNYLYALDIKSANTEEHMEAVIRSKDPKYCYLFAKEIKTADITRLGDVVINSKNPEYNYLFAKNIPNCNQEEHKRVIAESNNPEYNYLCCLIDDSDHTLNKLAVINSGSAEYNYKLALKFPKDEFYDEYIKVITASGDEEYISKLNNLKPARMNSIDKKIKLLQLTNNKK